ncbi:MAG: hypothetical protein ACW98G_16835 [Candidatus Hodarchaeales archaeon]|jgi:hypothetical protein
MNPILNLLIASFFVLTLSLIIFEKTHKTLAAMLGAGLSLLVAITPGSAEVLLMIKLSFLMLSTY